MFKVKQEDKILLAVYASFAIGYIAMFFIKLKHSKK
jgi:hypothetical protein